MIVCSSLILPLLYTTWSFHLAFNSGLYSCLMSPPPLLPLYLQDVAGAAAANQKFEHLYDLTPRRRKAKLNLLRGEEQQAGELFEKIEHHRLLRRARCVDHPHHPHPPPPLYNTAPFYFKLS